MSTRFTVYDSEAVDLMVAAISVDDGRAENFVKVTLDDPHFGTEQGADGHVVRFNKHSRIYTVEITLKNSSSVHAKFAALLAIDVASTGGAGVGAFLLKDRNGSTLLLGSQCWLEKPPDREFGVAVGDSTWSAKVVANAATMIFGGN